MCSAVCRRLTLHGCSEGGGGALGFGDVSLAATEVFSRQTSKPRHDAFGSIALIEEFAVSISDRRCATTSSVTQFPFGSVVARTARGAIP
jgi:hypothetical protein